MPIPLRARAVAAIAVPALLLAHISGCRRPEKTPDEQRLTDAKYRALDAFLDRRMTDTDIGIQLIGLRHGTSGSNALAIRAILFPLDAVWASAINATSMIQIQQFTNIALRPVEARVAHAATVTGLRPATVVEIGLEMLMIKAATDDPVDASDDLGVDEAIH